MRRPNALRIADPCRQLRRPSRRPGNLRALASPAAATCARWRKPASTCLLAQPADPLVRQRSRRDHGAHRSRSLRHRRRGSVARRPARPSRAIRSPTLVLCGAEDAPDTAGTLGAARGADPRRELRACRTRGPPHEPRAARMRSTGLSARSWTASKRGPRSNPAPSLRCERCGDLRRLGLLQHRRNRERAPASGDIRERPYSFS